MTNNERLSVVLGDRRYDVVRPWGVLPAGRAFGAISQLAVNSKGQVLIFQRSELPVVVLDQTGAYLDDWAVGKICDAHGICVAPDDRVFLVDRDAHQILILSACGELSQTLGERHRPHLGAPFNHPTDVAVARDGDVYVADGYGNSQVHWYSSSLERKGSWGRPGTGPGEFSTPHGIWVDRADRVLVADRENDRVQIFDREGTYINEWRDLDHPMDIYEDDRGMIFVTDCIPRLNMFAPDGRLAGRCRATWNAAHGIWGNRDGDLFLAEQTPSRVTKLCLVDDSG